MDYVRPLTEMLDLCVLLEPGFTDLENLTCFNASDDFVYLLGVCFCKDDIEGIKSFARSRLWFTYRKNFPAIGGTGPKSDKGWGCMLRCGQMLLAQALSIVHLGRNWQWTLKSADHGYRRLLSMFQDNRTSLFSIHQIAQMGVSEGKPLGEWFGPNTIAQVLKKLAVYDEWSRLAVHVALDNILISDDVKIMAAYEERKCSTTEPLSCPPDEGKGGLGERRSEWKRPLLIIVPLRLGLTVINNCYGNAIKEFFKLPQCAGIIGGRPNHAVYFFGQAGKKLLYLDPHVCQDVANVCIPESRASTATGNHHNINNANHVSSSSPSSSKDNGSNQIVVISASTTPASITPSCGSCELPTGSKAGYDCDTSLMQMSPLSTTNRNASDQSRETNNESGAAFEFDLPNVGDPSISGPPSSLSSASNYLVDVVTTTVANNALSSPNVNGSSSFVDAAEDDSLELVATSSSNSSLCCSASSHSYASATSSSSTEILMSSSAHADERRYSMLSAIDADETTLNNNASGDLPMDCSILNGGNLSASSLQNSAPFPSNSVGESLDAVYVGCMTTENEDTTNNEGDDDDEPTTDNNIRRHRHQSMTRKTLTMRCRSHFNEITGGLTMVDSSETNVEDRTEENSNGDRRKRRVKRVKRNSTNSSSKNETQNFSKQAMEKSEPEEGNNVASFSNYDNSSNAIIVRTEYEASSSSSNTVTTNITSPSQPSSNDETSQSPFSSMENAEKRNHEEECAKAEVKEEVANEEVDVDSFDDSTFHCPYLLHMDFESLDPSLALAFVCVCEDDYTDLVERLNTSVINASSPPIFEILENRPKGWPEFVPYALHDDSLKLKEYDDFGDPMFDSDDQFEILE